MVWIKNYIVWNFCSLIHMANKKTASFWEAGFDFYKEKTNS